MSTSPAVAAEDRAVFWAVVEDCLCAFHGLELDAVRGQTGQLRQALAAMAPSTEELFYHAEPFDVACDIAGRPLQVEDHLPQYLHIRDEKHGSGISQQFARQRGND